MRTPLRPRVVAILERSAWSGHGYSAGELASRLGASRNAVGAVLTKLVEAGLVGKDGAGKSTRYYWASEPAPHRRGRES